MHILPRTLKGRATHGSLVLAFWTDADGNPAGLEKMGANSSLTALAELPVTQESIYAESKADLETSVSTSQKKITHDMVAKRNRSRCKRTEKGEPTGKRHEISAKRMANTTTKVKN